VNVYGGNGTYYISNSSNSGIASANISGSTVNVYGYNTTGNSTFTVCSYNNSGCATLYVSVQANYNNNQPTYFSQSTVNLSVGQGQAITVYGSGSYNISSNSNPTAISALVSGNILNVYGSAPGSGTLNICSTSGSGGCSSLYVVVAGGYYNNYNYNGSNNYYNGYNNGYTGYNYNNGYNNGYNYNNTGYSYNNGYNYNTTYYPQNGSVLGASTDVPSQVYLSQVPATGVSATNLKTILFTLGLIIWSLFATYIFMAKQKRKALGR
jgi:hypothetical protein